MIANISQKIKHTNNTLKMDGIACTNALTTTCRSWNEFSEFVFEIR